MANFFQFLFGSSIPSTHKYEAKLLGTEQAFAQLNELANSTEYKRYLELKDYTSSPGFARKLDALKKLSYKGSPEQSAEKRYQKLKKSKEVKEYLKTNERGNSPYVTEYIKLSELLSSDEHIKRSQHLQDKHRHKHSEEYALLQEYEQLAKSEQVSLYAKLKKRYDKLFAERNMWECTFEDDFNQPTLGTPWSTKSFWSEAIVKQPYAQSTELQLPTDGKNIDIQGGLLSIVTRKEQTNGLAWDNKLGFIPKSFNYTSGVVNTSGSFRQQQGHFVAKLKLPHAKHLYHSFWLGSDAMLPHVTVCKVENGKVHTGVYTDGRTAEKHLSVQLNDEFYIFELQWNQSNMVWLINGKKVFESSVNLNAPLYLAFSSGVTADIDEHKLPQYLSIEWVRCYKKK